MSPRTIAMVSLPSGKANRQKVLEVRKSSRRRSRGRRGGGGAGREHQEFKKRRIREKTREGERGTGRKKTLGSRVSLLNPVFLNGALSELGGWLSPTTKVKLRVWPEKSFGLTFWWEATLKQH